MKTRLRLVLILMVTQLILSSCFIEFGPSHETEGLDKIRIMGSARRNPDTNLYEFDSASVVLDDIDITEALTPIFPTTLQDDLEDNVLFEYATRKIFSVNIRMTEKEGYVFDSWSITPSCCLIDDNMTDYEKRKLRDTLEEIEDYLDEETSYRIPQYHQQDKVITTIRRYAPVLSGLPVEYLPYLTAEYDPLPVHVSYVEKAPLDHVGNGTMDNPYTFLEFKDKYQDSREVHAIMKFPETSTYTDLSKAISAIAGFKNLEELDLDNGNEKIPCKTDITVFDNLESVALRHFTFDNKVELPSSHTIWTFMDCAFKDSLVPGSATVIIRETSN